MCDLKSFLLHTVNYSSLELSSTAINSNLFNQLLSTPAVNPHISPADCTAQEELTVSVKRRGQGEEAMEKEEKKTERTGDRSTKTNHEKEKR